MRRTDRLFEIIQLFRDGKLRRAEDVAHRLDVSVRTVYRDIESLILSGVPIEGERGVGYVLRQPIFLPPLTLTVEEFDALKLSVSMVARQSDHETSAAAQSLLAKIAAVLPEKIQRTQSAKAVAVHARAQADGLRWLPDLRFAIVNRRYAEIEYQSLDGKLSKRRVRPLQVEFWGPVWTSTCWCESQNDFRVFRVDLIKRCVILPDQFLHDAEKSLARYLERLAG